MPKKTTETPTETSTAAPESKAVHPAAAPGSLDIGVAAPILPLPAVYRSAASEGVALGDAAGGLAYVFTEDLALAVNAALATRRPLLLRGPPGSGKSSLARAVAGASHRAYLSKVVTSDSKLDDLLYSYDYVRRLQDASDAKRELLSDYEYVEPQALWWVLAPGAAMGRGVANRRLRREVTPPAGDPSVLAAAAVLLMDEIDKADPALPNDLLVALGEGQFRIRETGDTVVAETKQAPLIIITTNEERELSRPFVRRCIVAELPERSGDELRDWLIAVGTAHFARDGQATTERRKLIEATAKLVVAQAAAGESPSAAEFVDLLRACLALEVTAASATFGRLRRLVTTKMRRD